MGISQSAASIRIFNPHDIERRDTKQTSEPKTLWRRGLKCRLQDISRWQRG